jgi:hypothetical protein
MTRKLAHPNIARTVQAKWCKVHGGYSVTLADAETSACPHCGPTIEAVEPVPEVALDPDYEKGPCESVRVFGTGATRSPDTGRYDPEGYLSPIVVERFCQYMQKHQYQSDGTLRASDNWQKGMPRETYLKGMFRHFLHLWTRHRGYAVKDTNAAGSIEEDLCALLFNVQGYLFEILKQQEVNNVNRI